MESYNLLGLGPHGFHRLHYTEWGNPENDRVVICAHGLTRNGRDFDELGRALQSGCRVVCPDMPGRGRSDWLAVKSDYNYPVYMSDMAALLARLNVSQIDWVGTSMGGLIGMFLAAQANTPVRRLVLNDVGPTIPEDALQRIAEYVGADPVFPDLRSLEQYLRVVHAPFGPLTDAQWQHIAAHSVRRLAIGACAQHFDPGIAEGFKEAAATPVDLWSIWDRVECPVRVLRGSESDLLTAETAAEMTQRGPKADLVEFEGVGHAPALLAEEQIRAVTDWLR